MEKKLLDLATEYAALKAAIDGDPLPGMGVHHRSLDQIAAEYGATLKNFLSRD